MEHGFSPDGDVGEEHSFALRPNHSIEAHEEDVSDT